MQFIDISVQNKQLSYNYLLLFSRIEKYTKYKHIITSMRARTEHAKKKKNIRQKPKYQLNESFD